MTGQKLLWIRISQTGVCLIHEVLLLFVFEIFKINTFLN